MKIILIFIFFTTLLYSINITEIINCGDYYTGTGKAEVYQEAKDIALKQLTEQIVVTVRSSFVNKLKEKNSNINESVESILQTHSLATLNNLQEQKEPCAEGIKVFLYIKKSDVEKIFEERRKLIYDIYSQAVKNEEKGDIGNALKWYYYCSILMNSLPEERMVWSNINFSTEIPKRINNILKNINFNLSSDKKISNKERQIIFDVSYNNKPVNFIQFTFWDGTNQVRVEGKDGTATLDLLGASTNLKKLNINIEYTFYSCRKEFKAVSDLWNVVIHPKFNNKRTITLKKMPIRGKISNRIVFNNADSCNVADKIKSETMKFLSFFRNDTEYYFSDDAFLQKKIKRIIRYNHPKPIITDLTVDINKTYDGWELRRIPVLTNYPSIHKQTTEFFILDFNKNGKLMDVNFAIMDNLYKEFVKQAKYGNDWGNRSVIIKFIERYRTAFLNRNLAIIDSIFSDDAVIIVGRVVKKTKKLKDYKYTAIGDQPNIEYIRYKKSEYLKNLKTIFSAQQDIYLGYSTFKINKKNDEKGVYGVSLRQNYNSTTYSDEGHLFLLIDFNEDKPKIYVRSWQPQEWDDKDMIKMANFRINK
jgi:hypothetical protein